jgi:hypothetical protein
MESLFSSLKSERFNNPRLWHSTIGMRSPPCCGPTPANQLVCIRPSFLSMAKSVAPIRCCCRRYQAQSESPARSECLGAERRHLIRLTLSGGSMPHSALRVLAAVALPLCLSLILSACGSGGNTAVAPTPTVPAGIVRGSVNGLSGTVT